MLKRGLILFILALTQVSCYISEESGGYKPVELSSEWRQGLERSKRELLQLEDIKIGDGPIAALGRKVTADIEVRYASWMASPSIEARPSATLECKAMCSFTMT